MLEEYLKWHKIKSYLNINKKRPYFHEREIWFCSLGKNIGDEQDGKGNQYLRPVIVLKKFNKNIGLIIPLTKRNKTGRYYYTFKNSKDVQSTAILSQIRLSDVSRFKYLSGYISKDNFYELKEKLKKLIS